MIGEFALCVKNDPLPHDVVLCRFGNEWIRDKSRRSIKKVRSFWVDVTGKGEDQEYQNMPVPRDPAPVPDSG